MDGKKVKIFRNRDIKRILMGVPGEEHLHLRTIIETEDEFLVFQEATLSALVRAYIQIKNHPQNQAIEMQGTHPTHLKPGYANWQLIETTTDEEGIRREIKDILEGFS